MRAADVAGVGSALGCRAWTTGRVRAPGLISGGSRRSSTSGSKPADAALARRYPGERSGRQPVHTVYVPADRFHAGLVKEYGEWALWSVDDHEALLLELFEGDEALLDRGPREAGPRTGRGPADRLRGRLRTSHRRGGGHRRPGGRPGAARRDRAGRRPAVHRHPLQELREADPPPRPAHAGSLPRDAGRRRPAARRLRGHPAQGHLRRPGRGAGPHRPAAGDRARPGRPLAAGSSCRSRPRSRSSAPTARPWSPG